MGICGSCVFRTGYTLYARTCVGRCLHNRILDSFKKHYGENAVHSRLTPFLFNELLILPLPFLANNYCYLVADLASNNFVLIDVGDASKMKELRPAPDAILTTHKHWDHSGGNRQMKVFFPGLQVYGGVADHVPDHTVTVEDGQVLKFGRLKFTAIWTPGHTKGHIVWRLHGEVFDTADSIFSGDHLMLAGCGATFEGSPATMIESLEKMTELPLNTLMWPGHEVGVDGLEIAAFIEPDNLAVVLKFLWAITQREQMLCTCPSTILEEMTYNPFLRTKDQSFQQAIGLLEHIQKTGRPTDPKEISALCFEWIVDKAHELREFKKMRQKQIKKEEKEGEGGVLTFKDIPSKDVLEAKDNQEKTQASRAHQLVLALKTLDKTESNKHQNLKLSSHSITKEPDSTTFQSSTSFR